MNTTTENPIPLAPLWAAFVAAAAELTEPVKAATADVVTKTGQRFSYTYLTLPQLSELVRTVFARHGLAFRQQVTTSTPGAVTTTTTLLHASGATWTSQPLTMRAASGAPQDFGSVMTYCRRYQLAALVGLSGADDDDAAHQQPPSPSGTKTKGGKIIPNVPTGKPGDPQPMTDPQRRMLWAVARTAGYGDVAELAAFTAGQLGVDLDAANPDELLRTLTKSEASHVIDELQKVQPAERLATTPTDPWQDEPE